MIYLISDTHFNHNNIIKYSNRPFKDVREMNRSLIKNWNETVTKGDTIFFLGDFCYGNGNGHLKKLKGRKIMIRGNHDREMNCNFYNYKILVYRGIQFALLHNPADIFKFDAFKDFNGWMIHGHIHNNDLETYPFINYQNCTVNVSADLTDYRPMALDAICDLIANQKATAGTIWDGSQATALASDAL